MSSFLPSIYIPIFFSVLTLADLVPTAPGPGESYRAGSSCVLSWEPDTSGAWKNVTIDLMTGSNIGMTHVVNVVSGLDGTNSRLTPHSWTCPEVDPYSAIYFYQFTNGDDVQGSKWTTRFTITSPSGASVPPEHPTQPNGDAIPWGTGSLVAKFHNGTDEGGTEQDDLDDQTNSGNDEISRSSFDSNEGPIERSPADTPGDEESDGQGSVPHSTRHDREPSASARITPRDDSVPTGFVSPPRKDRPTASSSSAYIQITNSCQYPWTPPGNRLDGMQLTSGSVKIHVGLNIVPPLLVALFILF